MPIVMAIMLILSPNVTRIMLVRNPYARFLSGYLDKIVGDFQVWKKRIFPWLTESMEIKEPHFTPQFSHCGVQNGFLYDYYLKIEETELWYEELVRHLGMENVMQHGWGNLGQECFFYAKERSCENMFMGRRRRRREGGTDKGDVECREIAHDNDDKNDGSRGGEEKQNRCVEPLYQQRRRPSSSSGAITHSRTHAEHHSIHAEEQIDLYTDEAAEVVKKFYRADFVRFRYDSMLGAHEATGSSSGGGSRMGLFTYIIQYIFRGFN
eukprot:jgi/Bigna1/83181/fgenesh1_pg.103_\